jgi:hypothetical protein
MRFYILNVIIIVLVGCQDSNSVKNTKKENQILVKSDTLLVIPIDSETPINPFYIQQVEFKGNEALLLLNHIANKLQYYDLINGQLIKSIQIKKSGPKSIENINGVYHHNEDSIFVFERYKPKFLLVNDLGDALSSFSFYHPKNASNFFNSFGNYSNPNIYLKGKIYFTENDLTMRPNVVGFLKDFNSEYSYDLFEKEAAIVDEIKFPDVYHEYAWPNYFMYYKEKLGDYIVYSFPASKYLFFFNPTRKEVDTVFAGSTYFEDINNPYFNQNIELSSEKFEDFDLNYYSYGKVLTDEKTGFVYRFVKHPARSGSNNPSYHDAKYSIIVLDSLRRKIGEYLIDDNKTYSPYLSFISNSILFVSNHSIYNDTLSEDYMVFSKFKLVK